MHSLMARLPGSALAPDDAAAEAYIDALAEVLSDGRMTGEEAKLLAHLAGSAGMGGTEVLQLNQRFLDGLKIAALDDDILTSIELRQLNASAKALSLPDYFSELQPTARPEVPPLPTGSANSSTMSNSMEARGERGRQGLECSELDRAVPKSPPTLGVGLETVKSLLRDAKFYENPESDPSRLALAREAGQARGTGVTKDGFQDHRGLSPGKSTEAWRDAAMLADTQ